MYCLTPLYHYFDQKCFTKCKKVNNFRSTFKFLLQFNKLTLEKPLVCEKLQPQCLYYLEIVLQNPIFHFHLFENKKQKFFSFLFVNKVGIKKYTKKYNMANQPLQNYQFFHRNYSISGKLQLKYVLRSFKGVSVLGPSYFS